MLDAPMPGAATFRPRATAPPWAAGDADPAAAIDPPLLSLADAAEIVPLSQKALYRIAQSDTGPFRKVGNRWMVYADDLHEWVRSHPTGKASSAAPSRRPRSRRRGAGMRARVMESAE